MNGGVAFQKLIGQYEAAAPHENGEDGVDMPHHLLGCFHMLSLLSFMSKNSIFRNLQDMV